MVPITNKINTIDHSKDVTDAQKLVLQCDGDVPNTHGFYLQASSDFTAPAFYVGTDSAKKDCNMKITMVDVVLDHNGTPVEIQVPCLVNTKALKAGDALICHTKEPEKRITKKRAFDVI